MKHIASLLIFTAGLAVIFLLGWWARGARLDAAGQVVETRIDTVYYEQPQPIATTRRPVTVNVPCILFAGEHAKESTKVVAYSATTDYDGNCANNAHCPGSCSEIPNNLGNVSESPTSPTDSVQMQVEATPATNQDAAADCVAVEIAIETYTYEDSLYRAQVSGPAIGNYRPALDWIEVHGRTNTITRTKRHRFAVTAGVGAAYTPRGFQPTVGVQMGVILWGF